MYLNFIDSRRVGMLGIGDRRGAQDLAVVRERFLQGVGRTSTVLIGSQIRLYLARYFSLGELLVVILSIHVLLCSAPSGLPGFNVSWGVLRNLIQSILIQMGGGFIVSGVSDDVALLNLLLVLMVAESLPAFKGLLGDDLSSLTTTISFAFSDEVSLILRKAGVPLVGASLGLVLQGRGVFGQTMTLTGVNCISNAVFLDVRGNELSFAWPLFLLYFVHQVSGRYERVGAFVDYALYKASDAVYVGLSIRGVSPSVLAMVFAFVWLLLPGDPIWTSVCVLVLVQSSSAWLLGAINAVSNTDPVLAGLCVVTAVHFVCVGIKALCGKV